MIVLTFDEDGPHLVGEGVETAHQAIGEALGEMTLTAAALEAAAEEDIRERMRTINDTRKWQKVCR